MMMQSHFSKKKKKGGGGGVEKKKEEGWDIFSRIGCKVRVIHIRSRFLARAARVRAHFTPKNLQFDCVQAHLG